MPQVFVNFRGRDQAGYAALLDRELTEHFGPDAIFFSSRSIPPGDDYVAGILDSIRRCTVMLAVIGPNWLAAGVADERESTMDWTRREIAEAFGHGVRVIPILVEGAALPAEADLPEDVAAIARCQYLRLHHRTVRHDLARIIEELDRVLSDRRVDGAPHDDDAVRPGPWPRPRLFRLVGPRGSRCRIGILTGTIRRVRSVDIWVNSENTHMEMSRFTEFSVSGIIRYWGARRDHTGWVTADLIADELAARVGPHRPVAPCAAYVTGPGALAESNGVRHIIHVAAAQGEPGAGYRQVRHIDVCVTSALAQAERLATLDSSVRSIVFPMLGVGVPGAEVGATATALVDAAVDHLTANPDTALRHLYVLAHAPAELAALADALTATPRLAPTTT